MREIKDERGPPPTYLPSKKKLHLEKNSKSFKMIMELSVKGLPIHDNRHKSCWGFQDMTPSYMCLGRLTSTKCFVSECSKGEGGASGFPWVYNLLMQL